MFLMEMEPILWCCLLFGRFKIIQLVEVLKENWDLVLVPLDSIKAVSAVFHALFGLVLFLNTLKNSYLACLSWRVFSNS